MYIIKVDFTKCEDCGMCEELLPGFRNRLGGIRCITSGVRDEEILAAADRVKAACPQRAIILTKYEDKQ